MSIKIEKNEYQSSGRKQLSQSMHEPVNHVNIALELKNISQFYTEIMIPYHRVHFQKFYSKFGKRMSRYFSSNIKTCSQGLTIFPCV